MKALYYKPTLLASGLLVGLITGYLLWHVPSNQRISTSTDQHINESPNQRITESSHQTYTCAMHPQIRQPKPGNCPICGMELIPVEQYAAMADNNKMVEMSPAAIALASVQTSVVKTASEAAKEISLTGKIKVDERKIFEVPAYFPGRVEKLLVNFTGQYVSKGEILASVYSPDLVTAQQELLEAISYKESNPAMYRAARKKLENWKIAVGDIDKVEKLGKVMTNMPIRAHHSGYVMKRNVEAMSQFKSGDILFQMANLSDLWLVMDAYERDLAAINKGDAVQFTVPSVPDKVYKARVTYIDPFIDPQTRIAKVRAEVGNPTGELKPEMFVRGVVNANLSRGSSELLIPQSAVLWTGKRSLVYVKTPNTEVPTFEYREVTLGPEAGQNYIITSGLQAGEEVVSNGAFTIDAAAQLSGKASMMEPQGAGTDSPAHHTH